MVSWCYLAFQLNNYHDNMLHTDLYTVQSRSAVLCMFQTEIINSIHLLRSSLVTPLLAIIYCTVSFYLERVSSAVVILIILNIKLGCAV